jgi:hypothetical protein
VPTELPVTGQNLHERLIAGGFQEEKLGEARPSVSHYHLVSGRTGFYAEFLTRLEGGASKRDRERGAIVRVASVSSQRLRYIDLLLIAPWTVEIGIGILDPIRQASRIQLPAPASFLAQKVLILHERDRADRAKDDTIETVSAALPAIREEWDATVKNGLRPNAFSVGGDAGGLAEQQTVPFAPG